VRAIELKLTILSIPLGPREVRTTSATAIKIKVRLWGGGVKGLTFGGNDVGGSDVLRLLGVESSGGLTCAHIIVILNFNLMIE
jgi:hypothetical protein